MKSALRRSVAWAARSAAFGVRAACGGGLAAEYAKSEKTPPHNL